MKLRTYFKSLAAGWKMLFSRIGQFCGIGLAVNQIALYVFTVEFLKDTCAGVKFLGTNLYELLTQPLVYLGIAVVIAILSQGAFTRYCKKIKGTDKRIAIEMGDILNLKGNLVIPCNNTFISDTDMTVPSSIHYKMVMRSKVPEEYKEAPGKYYDDEIKKILLNDPKYVEQYICPGKLNSIYGVNYQVYKFGTAVPFSPVIDKKKRDVTLVSMSMLTDRGVARTDREQENSIFSAIDAFWNYVEDNGIKGSTLVMPLMGTGAAGTDAKRQDVARYLLRTYAKRSPKLGIHKFILCIYPGDYLNNDVNIAELRNYCDFLCSFPDRDK